MRTRNTIQRTLVRDAVGTLDCHATAEEVYAFLSKEHPTISKATVYRNLKDLSESGDLKRIESTETADHYDHNCHDHYHVQCIHCGRVHDVDMDFMGDIYDRIKGNHGFIIESHDVIFKGICPDCNKTQS